MAEDAVVADKNPDSMGEEHVGALWTAFRAGRDIVCPHDENHMAIAVDAAMGAYRLVCVGCGHATPWFEARGGIVRIRRYSSRPPPGSVHDV